jgi:hypothetical protein
VTQLKYWDVATGQYHALTGPGRGVPPGGTTGDSLVKVSQGDYDTAWRTFLPPPLAAADPFTTHTDPNGEVWVAKGSVAAGAWKKPADVLHARVVRATAWTSNIALTPVVFDQATKDDFAMFNLTTGEATLPVAGWWRVDTVVAVSSQTVQTWTAIAIQLNGATDPQGGQINDTFDEQGTWQFPTHLSLSLFGAAGDKVRVLYNTQVDGYTGRVNQTWCCLDYMGAG